MQSYKKTDIPSIILLSKWPQWPVLGQAEVRGPAVQQGLPCGQQQLSYLEHLLLPFQAHQLGAGWEPQPQYGMLVP